MKTKLFFSIFLLPFLASAQFSQNFDAATTTPTGWTVINGGDANGFIFAVGAPNSAYSAPNAAQINYSTTAHDDYLVTPAITVTAGVNDRLTYYVKNQDPDYVENFAVKISTTTPTAAAFTTTVTPSAGAPNTWTKFTINLTPYIGQTIYIGFHATSTDKFRLLFDDIVNDSAASLAIDDVVKSTSKVVISPNPMKDFLNISNADKKILEVAFYSIDGKLIKTSKKNASTISVNDLKSGVYIIKVKTSDSEETFKVIKE